VSKTPKEQLEEKLTRVGDCLEWQGGKTGRGYGTIWLDGIHEATHRLAWVLANGRPIPEGMYVLHSCDNKICCEPEHLRLGTQAENMQQWGDSQIEKPLPPSPGMARLIATYNRNKARRLAREAANAN